ncbi:uncharacterized protein LOC135936131 [Cloeon dipterum]|uniref:uncharacterized protein LOC135936131 n=1 Tax=Cloeon dipterum TaxID=197152 RepID=UPI0032204907
MGEPGCMGDEPLTAVLIANVVLMVLNGIVLAVLGVNICRRSVKQRKSESIIAITEKPTEEPFYEPVKYNTPNEVTYEVPNEIDTPIGESEYATADEARTPAGPDYLAVIG